MNKIIDRLQENYNTVEAMGYELVGIFLQGSQNYELAYKGSDIDCKALILPKFNDFVLSNKAVSFTHVLENNEHIDIKDIRSMFDCFKKQNINFIEILFTKYRVINPKYQTLIQPLFNNKEKIARYNNYASVNCMCGMALEKYKALEHPYPATMSKIEKFGYDPKQLHHIIRLNEFMGRYIAGDLYENCLVSKCKDYLIEVKKGKHSLEEARKLAKEQTLEIVASKNQYMSEQKLVVNKECEEILNTVLLNTIRDSFISELMGGEK